eukprot:7358086-Heterocapsa_arctica.AAC.1
MLEPAWRGASSTALHARHEWTLTAMTWPATMMSNDLMDYLLQFSIAAGEWRTTRDQGPRWPPRATDLDDLPTSGGWTITRSTTESSA